jgi:hypothetical protein
VTAPLNAVARAFFCIGHKMKINLSEIRIDGGTQSRVEINQQVVDDYAEAIKVGIRFPEISVFFDGVTYWLVDGFHRYHAHRVAGKVSIDAESKDGTQREAVQYSLGVNSEHGLRRSNADKRKAIDTALDDPEWSQWSSRQIAEMCAVSPRTVDAVRDEREKLTAQMRSEEPRKYVTKHGTEAVMNTTKIGRATAPVSTPAVAPLSPSVKSEPQIPDGEEDAIDEANAAIAYLYEIAEADKPLKAALETVKLQAIQIAHLTKENDRLMNEVAQARGQVNYWKKKAPKQ